MSFMKRISRWIQRDGLRGTVRRCKYIFAYWRFRGWVLLLRKPPKAPQAGLPTGAVPKFSILLPAYRSRFSWLMEAVNSVRNQTEENWELCIGLCEVSTSVRQALQALSQRDNRIRLFELETNGGISENSNVLARKAAGEFLAILDHDDYLEPHALREVSACLQTGSPDLVYTDEDIVSPWLRLPAPPNLKPVWSPETFRSSNYICHFCCFRRSLFEEVGGFRSDYDGSQDYDLFLRLIEKSQRIAHVPKVLYHWRRHGFSTASGKDVGAKPQAWEASRRALESHLLRQGENARVEMGNAFGSLRVRYVRSGNSRVEIIIPSSNSGGILPRCLENILNHTSYPHYQITGMLNGSDDFTALKKEYAGNTRVLLRDFREPFNFSRINNAAARQSDADVFLFLNDDIEVIHEDWLEGLLEHALNSEIGAVGPMLLYPDNTIQHSGLILDPDEIALDFHRRLPQTADGYQSHAQIIQNVSAVTGACLCTRREPFFSVGGFDEQFPMAYNDVDYCLKLLSGGYRIVYDPFIRLIHHESLTRGLDHHGEKFDRLQREKNKMREKWAGGGLCDRYFDPQIFKPGADFHTLAGDYLRPSVS